MDDEHLVAFCEHWNLNEDAMVKLFGLEPDIQTMVVESYDPPADCTDHSVPFTMFASGVEKSGGVKGVKKDKGKGKGKKGKGKKEGKPKSTDGEGSVLEYLRAQVGSPQGKKESPAVPKLLARSADATSEGIGAKAVSPADRLHDRNVEAFCAGFDLNDAAKSKLQELSQHAQAVVMKEFNPPSHFTEVSGKFILFASSIQKADEEGRLGATLKESEPPSRSGGPKVIPKRTTTQGVQSTWSGASGMSSLQQGQKRPLANPLVPNAKRMMGRSQIDPVTAFIQQWNLNEDAQAKLMQLDESQLEIVLSNFEPPPNATNVDGKVIKFAASIQKNQAAAAVAAGLAPFQQQEDPVTDFIMQWNLNEDAQAKLLQLNESQLEVVLSNFVPPPGATEVNGKLIKFANSIMRNQASGLAPGQGYLDPVTAFIQQWNLNEDAQAKLMQLDEKQLEITLSDFDPPPGASQVNGIFIKFASSIQRNHSAAPIQKKQAAAPILKKKEAAPAAGGLSTFQRGLDPVSDFIEHYNLNEDAQAKLMQLDESQMEIVLSNFEPPPNATQVNGKLIKFANSIQRNQAASFAPSQKKLDPKTVIAFIQQWSLNGDAQEKLMQLDESQLDLVISNFAPPAGSTEVNGKLIKFANSIQRNQSIQAAGIASAHKHVDPEIVMAFIQQWNLNEDAQAKLMQLDASQLEVVLSNFAPPAEATEVNGKLIKFANSIQRNQANFAPVPKHVDPKAVIDFIEQWNLNEDAQAKLMQLDVAQWEVVRSNFAPPPDSPEVNGKLIKFANSIQRNQTGSWSSNWSR